MAFVLLLYFADDAVFYICGALNTRLLLKKGVFTPVHQLDKMLKLNNTKGNNDGSNKSQALIRGQCEDSLIQYNATECQLHYTGRYVGVYVSSLIIM